MPEMAKVIRVRQRRGEWSLEIDGVEFPWHVAPGVRVAEIARGSVPGVDLRIIADRVEVEHDLGFSESS